MTIWNGKTGTIKKQDEVQPFHFDEKLYEDEHSEQIFIDTLVANKDLVQLFLLGGVRILGNIVGSDDFTIAINTRNSGVQLVYKNAITTISKYTEQRAL